MSFRTSALLAAAFFIAMQTFVLPPDGFITGDQGSKFLQTRAFAEHGPMDPSIDVMARDIDPQFAHQEPKLKNRRGRLVSEFLWLLPLTSAPFVRVLGIRGMYVVPALSVIVLMWGVMRLTRRFDGHVIDMWTALLVTPVVLFGLELWEHAPAAACVVLAAEWLAPGQASPRRFVAAGAAVATGVLFREEVAPALPALLLARAWAQHGDRRWTDLMVASAWAGVGAVAVVIAAVPMNLLVYGAPLPMHMTQDAWEVAKNTPYFQVRRDVIVDLLFPLSHVWLFSVTLIVATILAVLGWRRRAGGAPPVLLNCAVVVTLLIAVLLPIWRLAIGVTPHLAYRWSSAAHTWVFAAALLYWPWLRTRRYDGTARYLVTAAALLFLGTAVLVPTSGGSQWSPRFMLAVAPLLGVVAAAAWRHSAGAVRGAVAAILIASFVMQLTGILALVVAKRRNAALTHWLASRTAPGEVLISNVYWFPEITASLATTRRFLFSWSAADVPALAGLAVRRGLPRFSLVTSLPLTGYEAPAVLDIPGAPCQFVRGQQIALDPYGLTLSRYGCAP